MLILGNNSQEALGPSRPGQGRAVLYCRTRTHPPQHRREHKQPCQVVERFYSRCRYWRVLVSGLVAEKVLRSQESGIKKKSIERAGLKDSKKQHVRTVVLECCYRDVCNLKLHIPLSTTFATIGAVMMNEFLHVAPKIVFQGNANGEIINRAKVACEHRPIRHCLCSHCSGGCIHLSEVSRLYLVRNTVHVAV